MIKLPALFAIKDAAGFQSQADMAGCRSSVMAQKVIEQGVFRVSITHAPYFAVGEEYLYDTEIPYGEGTIGLREDELQFFEVISDE